MARYRGPVEKLERRLGVSLALKGERRLAGKSALDKRPYAPGQHGQRRAKISEYGLQLREKQKAKFMYGVSEKQFRRIFDEAARKEGNTGINLVLLIERRLDNVVYRLGFTKSRFMSRQFVSHGHVLVNGKKVTIPSFQVKEGDVIELSQKIQKNPDVVKLLAEDKALLPFLERKATVGKLNRMPKKEDVEVPFNMQLIIEYYSR